MGKHFSLMCYGWIYCNNAILHHRFLSFILACIRLCHRHHEGSARIATETRINMNPFGKSAMRSGWTCFVTEEADRSAFALLAYFARMSF